MKEYTYVYHDKIMQILFHEQYREGVQNGKRLTCWHLKIIHVVLLFFVILYFEL